MSSAVAVPPLATAPVLASVVLFLSLLGFVRFLFAIAGGLVNGLIQFLVDLVVRLLFNLAL